jgi:hypothetical protein
MTNKIFIVCACPKGRAIHYIFSFPKERKEKDAISIPHAARFQNRIFDKKKPRFINNEAGTFKIESITH